MIVGRPLKDVKRLIAMRLLEVLLEGLLEAIGLLEAVDLLEVMRWLIVARVLEDVRQLMIAGLL